MDKNNKELNNQKAGCIGCLSIVIIIIIVTAVISFLPKESKYSYEPKEIDAPKYEVIKVEDLSLGKYIRINYWVSVSHSYSKEDLKKIFESVVESEKVKQPISSVGIVFFSDKIDTVTNEKIIKGDAEWGPYGEWGKAMDVEPGDYSHHDYTYNFNTHIEGNF